MPNKPIKQGYKIYGIADHGYCHVSRDVATWAWPELRPGCLNSMDSFMDSFHDSFMDSFYGQFLWTVYGRIVRTGLQGQIRLRGGKQGGSH